MATNVKAVSKLCDLILANTCVVGMGVGIIRGGDQC